MAALLDISYSEPKPDDQFSFAVSPFADAWSIVDSIHRFRGLLKHLPGLAKKNQSAEFRNFASFAAQVEDLRNVVQHLNQEIGKRENTAGSIWGALTWLVFPEDGVCVSCYLVPGSFNLMGSITAQNPAGKTPRRRPIDYVTLSHGKSVVDLTEAMASLEAVCSKLETSLSEQFAPFAERMGSDIVIKMVGDLSPDGSQWTLRPDNSRK
jgi:hypothetical protein